MLPLIHKIGKAGLEMSPIQMLKSAYFLSSPKRMGIWLSWCCNIPCFFLPSLYLSFISPTTQDYTWKFSLISSFINLLYSTFSYSLNKSLPPHTPEIAILSFNKFMILRIALNELIRVEIIHWEWRRNKWPENHPRHPCMQTPIYWAPTMYQSPIYVLGIQMPIKTQSL